METFEQKLTALAAKIELDNIEFRVQSVNKKDYATILCYKDARFDMNLLDKVIGPGNWQRKHEFIGGVMYCSVGIWNPDIKEWVWKQDAGTESKTEKQKGQASDSFKRACFNWGLGRELYDFPCISMKLNPNEVTEKDYGGKKIKTTTYDFQPNNFKWGLIRDPENQEIIRLVCIDSTQKIRFDWKHPDFETRKPKKEAAKTE